MSPLTNALIHYWQRLPASRRRAPRCLESACERVARRRGAPHRAAALRPGPTRRRDRRAATRAWFAGPLPASAEDDARGQLDGRIECVRAAGPRTQPRGGVRALLSLGDEATLERLPALRLVLSATEVEVRLPRARAGAERAVVEFLVDWLALLADGPTPASSGRSRGVAGWIAPRRPEPRLAARPVVVRIDPRPSLRPDRYRRMVPSQPDTNPRLAVGEPPRTPASASAPRCT